MLAVLFVSPTKTKVVLQNWVEVGVGNIYTIYSFAVRLWLCYSIFITPSQPWKLWNKPCLFIHFLNTETQRIVLNFVDYQFLRFYTTIFLVASPRGIEYQRQITKVANNSKCKSTFKSCRLWSLTDQSSLYCTLPRSEKVGILEITHAICILLTWMTE